jgi:hypothetical protein
MESSLGLVRSFRVLPSSSGRCFFALARAEALTTTKVAAAPPMRFAPLQRFLARGSGMMTGFASPGRLRLQVFSTSWRLDPPRACRPCFMPDPLLGLHPPELSSSRAAVRRLQRLSPHVVGCFRRTCLTGETRRAPNPNAETMEPVVQRQAPEWCAPLPKQRDPPSNARWKSRTPFANAEAPVPVLRHPNAESRVPVPKHRAALFNARRASESKARCRSTAPRLPTPAPAPRSETRRRNAEPVAGRHPTPNTESPTPKRRAPVEAPTPKRRAPFASATPKRRESSGHAPPKCRALARSAPPKWSEPAVQSSSRDRRRSAGLDRPLRTPTPRCRSTEDPLRPQRRSAGIP